MASSSPESRSGPQLISSLTGCSGIRTSSTRSTHVVAGVQPGSHLSQVECEFGAFVPHRLAVLLHLRTEVEPGDVDVQVGQLELEAWSIAHRTGLSAVSAAPVGVRSSGLPGASPRKAGGEALICWRGPGVSGLLGRRARAQDSNGHGPRPVVTKASGLQVTAQLGSLNHRGSGFVCPGDGGRQVRVVRQALPVPRRCVLTCRGRHVGMHPQEVPLWCPQRPVDSVCQMAQPASRWTSQRFGLESRAEPDRRIAAFPEGPSTLRHGVARLNGSCRTRPCSSMDAPPNTRGAVPGPRQPNLGSCFPEAHGRGHARLTPGKGVATGPERFSTTPDFGGEAP